MLGINSDAALTVLKSLGFKAKLTDGNIVFSVRRRTPPHIKAQRLAERAVSKPTSDSPFAKLKELIPS